MNRTILEKMFSFPKNLKILFNNETRQTFFLKEKALTKLWRISSPNSATTKFSVDNLFTS